MIISCVVAAGIAALTSCGGQKKKASVPAIDVNNLDTSVSPAKDFYQYACGGWQKNNPLTDQYGRFGTFDQLRENSSEQLRELVDEITTKEHAEGSIAQKISTFYNLGLDSVKLNADGAAPIKEQLAEINRVSNREQFSTMLANLHRQGLEPYFVTFITSDAKNSDMNITCLYQSGLGLGEKDYYTEKTADANKIRAAYKSYIKQLFTLAGYTPAQAEAAVKAVLKVENKIANAAYSKEKLRDSYKNYNKMSVSELVKHSKIVDWNVYLKTLGLSGIKEINVMQKDYYSALDKAFKDVTIAEHRYYLAFSLIRGASSYLSDDFVDASFDFYGRTMSGTQEQQPRWRRALTTVDGALSEAMGRLYVERYFPASSKEKMLELVKNLGVALGERIDGLEWMSDATKARAHEKLATFNVKIGYPDKWVDYSNLEIREDSYWANVRRSRIFEMEYNLAEADKPVDKSHWFMSPQTVNAYYNPTTNEICFPAAILQPPFFNPDADDAVNYGGIGVVIGHEMIHGFDDQGRNYDAAGNLSDWWTKDDASRFENLADKLVAQFDAIEVAPGVNANGRFTLGENIADQGGLLVSYKAYMNTLKNGKEPKPIDGLTAAQRFYVGYATLWAQNVRHEEVLRLTKVDVHSLGIWRVNATLRNVDDFYAAFDIKEGDDMYMAPEERVVIW